MSTLNKLRRKFGFNKDNSGIMSRYLYEEENWHNHLKNSKEFILQNLEGKQKGTCLVLGSGWCLDIPLEELTQRFRKVILADLIHPRQIEHKIRSFSGIELLTVDISGVLETFFGFKKDKKNTGTLLTALKNRKKESFINVLEPDIVISANILSQLAFFPVEFIKKYRRDVEEKELLSVKKLIEEEHLDMLPEDRSVLITDYYREEYSFAGELIHERDCLTVNLPKEKIMKEWMLDFDLKGNYETGNPVKFKVAALQV